MNNNFLDSPIVGVVWKNNWDILINKKKVCFFEGRSKYSEHHSKVNLVYLLSNQKYVKNEMKDFNGCYITDHYHDLSTRLT